MRFFLARDNHRAGERPVYLDENDFWDLLAEDDETSGSSSSSIPLCEVTGVIPSTATIPINTNQQFTAEGENLDCVEWSTNPSGDPASGEGPTFTTQWSQPGNKTVTAECGDSVATANAVAIKAELKSVEFTSDHGLLKKNPTTGSIWGDSNTSFEKPEWVAGSRNNPISHTKNTKITIKVKVKVEPAGIAFDLIGNGSDDYVDFEATGNTSTGADQEITLTAKANLPNQVCTLSKSIAWKIKVGTLELSIGSSGAHKIYVTYGTPAGSAVTEKRIEAVCTYASGKSELKECADAVFDHLPTFSAYGNAPTDGPAPIWLLYDSAQNPLWRSQCPGHAIFVNAHFQMLGLGAGQIKYCYAKPDGTYSADDDKLGFQSRSVANTNPAHPANTTHDDVALMERLAMIDSNGNANTYQAACLFNGYFYVLGYGRMHTSARDVVQATFVEIAWQYRTSIAPDTWSNCYVAPWIEGVPTG